MIAIDTNLLVRMFVVDKDSKHQADLIRQLLADKQEVYISSVVQIELVWVLKSAYGYDRASIIKVLKTMNDSAAFVLQNADEFATALNLFQTANTDFSDYLIVSSCRKQGFQLWTFDRKLAKTDGVFRLT